jgi:uncharacterized membrane protein YidH (DUF202 family)
MGTHPLDTGNYVLILLGLVLIASGPYIAYRTLKDIRSRRALGDVLNLQQWLSHGLNFVIAFLFAFAGVLFIWNNLRGNPLA